MVMDLEFMKMKIEAMSKVNQIEVLRILKNTPNAKINENKSGVFVNMSFLPIATITEIETYIQYVEEQEESLQTVELQKDDFKNEYFD
jgi:hypothetical protein